MKNKREGGTKREKRITKSKEELKIDSDNKKNKRK